MLVIYLSELEVYGPTIDGFIESHQLKVFDRGHLHTSMEVEHMRLTTGVPLWGIGIVGHQVFQVSSLVAFQDVTIILDVLHR